MILTLIEEKYCISRILNALTFTIIYDMYINIPLLKEPTPITQVRGKFF